MLLVCIYYKSISTKKETFNCLGRTLSPDNSLFVMSGVTAINGQQVTKKEVVMIPFSSIEKVTAEELEEKPNLVVVQ